MKISDEAFEHLVDRATTWGMRAKSAKAIGDEFDRAFSVGAIAGIREALIDIDLDACDEFDRRMGDDG